MGYGDWCMGEKVTVSVRTSRAETEQSKVYGRAGKSKVDGLQKKGQEPKWVGGCE